MPPFLRKIVVQLGIVSLVFSCAVAVLSSLSILPQAWFEPTLLSLVATAVGGVFLFFAAYLDDHHFRGERPDSLSSLRLALGAAAAFAIVSFFEGMV